MSNADKPSELGRAILRFLADDEQNGFGTEYGWSFCRLCPQPFKYPLGIDTRWMTIEHWRLNHPDHPPTPAYTCDESGCSASREVGVVFCRVHLAAEYERWLAAAEKW